MASFQPGLPPFISTPMPYGSMEENFSVPRMSSLAPMETMKVSHPGAVRAVKVRDVVLA